MYHYDEMIFEGKNDKGQIGPRPVHGKDIIMSKFELDHAPTLLKRVHGK